jgi:hypothetical protein
MLSQMHREAPDISGIYGPLQSPIPAAPLFPAIPPLQGCKGPDLTDKNWPVWAVTCLIGGCFAILFVVAALWITYKPPADEARSGASAAATDDGVEELGGVAGTPANQASVEPHKYQQVTSL